MNTNRLTMKSWEKFTLPPSGKPLVHFTSLMFVLKKFVSHAHFLRVEKENLLSQSQTLMQKYNIIEKAKRGGLKFRLIILKN